MVPIKRVGGKGDFTINKSYFQDGRYYVGESGGLQDFMGIWDAHGCMVGTSCCTGYTWEL